MLTHTGNSRGYLAAVPSHLFIRGYIMNDLESKSFGEVYCCTNKVNNKSYIGQSVDFEKRKLRHLNVKDNLYFHRAIKKYGIDNFEWKILCECSSKYELDEKEKYYIKELNTIRPYGYNLTYGGGGGDTFTNNPNKEEIRLKNTGKNNPNYGRIGNKHPMYNKIGKDNPTSKTYEVIYPDGKIKIIKGLVQFCKDNGLYPKNINRYVDKNKLYKGFIIKKIEE